jgi:hypothetical protein
MFCNRGSSFLIGSLMVLVCSPAWMHSQYRQEPGRSLGSITTRGNLIIMTLDEGVLGKPNLFNLAHHSVRLTRMAGVIALKTSQRRGIQSSGLRSHKTK